MSLINRFAINRIVNSTPPRPRPFSLWSESTSVVSDYTSWPSLTDRAFSDRHLPPADPTYTNGLPPDAPYQQGPPIKHGDVTGLFKRDREVESRRSTVLFATFAQWFTDSILRFDPSDRRKNTSTHQVDLCQIYGQTEETAKILRTKQLGRLKSQFIDGGEFLPNLYDASRKLKPEFEALPYVEQLDAIIWTKFASERKDHYYATGLERGNVTIGYAAVSTLFLREHNRLCGELQRRYPRWNDERLFQTARNILIVLLLKLVIEDYINHIASTRLIKFRLERHFGEEEKWYRTNWIALEFDLLYRWHSLVTDTIRIGEAAYGEREYMVNNLLLEQVGLGAAIDALSRQPAGRIGLFNTPEFLLRTEYSSLQMGRIFRLRSFNDYRERFGLSRIKDFAQLTSDGRVADRLASLYRKIDRVELYVGLFAEEASGRTLFGELMTRMVAVDAFSQIFTNPLLSRYVDNKDTFSSYGLDVIEETGSIQDLLNRNVESGSSFRASLGL